MSVELGELFMVLNLKLIFQCMQHLYTHICYMASGFKRFMYIDVPMNTHDHRDLEDKCGFEISIRCILIQQLR